MFYPDPDFAGIEEMGLEWDDTKDSTGFDTRSAPIPSASPAFGTLAQRMGQSRPSGGEGYYGMKSSGGIWSKPKLPEYVAPKMDSARISELTEIGMGPALGKLRQGLDTALIESRYSRNPNVRALSKKSALSGYGTGLADVRAGAHQAALGEYAPEYQGLVTKTGLDYQAAIDQYKTDMEDYLKGTKDVRSFFG